MIIHHATAKLTSRIDIIGQNGNEGLHYDIRTRLNGGSLSFTECAKAWPQFKPSYHVEDAFSWAGKFTMKQWRENDTRPPSIPNLLYEAR